LPGPWRVVARAGAQWPDAALPPPRPAHATVPNGNNLLAGRKLAFPWTP